MDLLSEGKTGRWLFIGFLVLALLSSVVLSAKPAEAG